MIDVERFIGLPFSKQLHICVLKWLQNQNITPFSQGKPVPSYFKCRAVLLKLERQTIKNIVLMLDDVKEPVALHKLEHRAEDFIRRQQMYIEQSQSPARKEYKIDAEAFISPIERR